MQNESKRKTNGRLSTVERNEDRQVFNEEWIRQLIREEIEKYFERQVLDFD